MNAKDYSEAAHSTAVHGGTLVYPFAALAEENMEVICAYASMCKDKVIDELMDVVWNINELCVLMDIPFDKVVEEAELKATKVSPIKKWILNRWNKASMNSICTRIISLGVKIGKLNGVFAKYVRKHDGVVPTPKELYGVFRTYDGLIDGACNLHWFKAHINERLVTTTSLIIEIFDRLNVTLEEGFNINISKLAKRKNNGTLAATEARKE